VEIWAHNTGIVHWEYFPDSRREMWRLHGHDLAHHLADDNGDWLAASPVLRGADRQAAKIPAESTEKQD
jgi:hypothetical protein